MDKVVVYFQILAVSFPTLIGIITAISAESESFCGNFQTMLSGPSKKMTIHLAKLLSLLLFGLIAILFAGIGFGLGFQESDNELFSLVFFTKISLLIFLTSVPLYLIHYFLSFQFGKELSIGVGIVGSLLSALLLTGLGDPIWRFLFWGIPIRLGSIYATCFQLNISFSQVNNVTYAFCFLVVSSIVILVLMMIWSIKWEGLTIENE